MFSIVCCGSRESFYGFSVVFQSSAQARTLGEKSHRKHFETQRFNAKPSTYISLAKKEKRIEKNSFVEAQSIRYVLLY